MFKESSVIISYLQNYHFPEEIRIIFCECLNNYSNKSFNINCLCKNTGMNYYEIYEKLINHLNLCPSKILENIRMEYVLAQLKSNNISINRLSSKAGYSRIRSFRRAFKRCTGVTANECKIKLQNDDENQTQYKYFLKRIWERKCH